MRTVFNFDDFQSVIRKIMQVFYTAPDVRKLVEHSKNEQENNIILSQIDVTFFQKIIMRDFKANLSFLQVGMF